MKDAVQRIKCKDENESKPWLTAGLINVCNKKSLKRNIS